MSREIIKKTVFKLKKAKNIIVSVCKLKYLKILRDETILNSDSTLKIGSDSPSEVTLYYINTLQIYVINNFLFSSIGV